ncbi:MAG: hypothetical protein AB7G21_06475 [Dehalococcoidia bacterium]
MEQRHLSWRFVLLWTALWFPTAAAPHIWGFTGQALGLPQAVTNWVFGPLVVLVWGVTFAASAAILDAGVRVPFAAWFGATLAGAVLATFLWRELVGLVPVFERVSLPSRSSHYFYLFMTSAAFGLALALPQVVALARGGFRRRLWLWPLASAIGWGGTPHTIWLVPIGLPLFSILPLGYDFVVTVVIIAWLGILPGLVTGLALKRIVEAQPVPPEDVDANADADGRVVGEFREV